MKLVVSFLLLLHVVAAVDVEWMQIQPSLESQHIDNIWQAWKDIYAKSYSPREEAYRRSVFVQKLEEVSSHNARYPMEVSYTLGLNHFSDMTHEEYKAYNKLQARANLTRDGATFLPPMNVDQLPATVDWRTKGMVTPVKNQGQCGSCWAFSATGSLEGQHARKTGSLLSLSEQQLVDCSGPSGNNGCDGGLMDNAFRYIMNQPGGLETEQSYPYTAVDGTCVSNPSLEVASVRGYTDLPFGNEEALKTASATVGPISVAIDANHPSFQSYHSGVYNEPLCSSTKLDHGVLVVGYGTQNGQDYWLVKNSWGTSWGQSGYILMARNNNNMCGIATMASYPLV